MARADVQRVDVAVGILVLARLERVADDRPRIGRLDRRVGLDGDARPDRELLVQRPRWRPTEQTLRDADRRQVEQEADVGRQPGLAVVDPTAAVDQCEVRFRFEGLEGRDDGPAPRGN